MTVAAGPIAQSLYLAESTVKQHLRAAYKELGVHNRNEAAVGRGRGSLERELLLRSKQRALHRPLPPRARVT